MFIQTESTPNPNSLKFLLDLDLDNKSYEFSSIEECSNSDLAKLLFQINGVEKVFFGQDFISINKKNYDWDQLKAPILTIISDYISSGKRILNDINQIDKIYSHPQSFAQCQIWLKANLPSADLVPVFSNSEAAEIVASHNEACIGSKILAKLYGLNLTLSLIHI